MSPIEISISIGSEDDDHGINVTIGDDSGWNVDLLEMAATRAVSSAITCWRELHPETETATP